MSPAFSVSARRSWIYGVVGVLLGLSGGVFSAWAVPGGASPGQAETSRLETGGPGAELWATRLPGKGSSRPLLVEDRLVVTAMSPSPARQLAVVVPWAVLSILGLLILGRHPGGQPAFDADQLGERTSYPGGILRAAIFGSVGLAAFEVWRWADAVPSLAPLGQAGGPPSVDGFSPPADLRVLMAVGALGGLALAVRRGRRAAADRVDRAVRLLALAAAGAAVMPMLLDGPSILGWPGRSWISVAQVLGCALVAAALGTWRAGQPAVRRLAWVLPPLAVTLFFLLALLDPSALHVDLAERLGFRRFQLVVASTVLGVTVPALRALRRNAESEPDHPPLSAVLLVASALLVLACRLGVVPATGWTPRVVALEKSTGEIAWTRDLPSVRLGAWVAEAPAASSPATDGERIFADFGPAGFVALDLDGRVAWSRDPLGPGGVRGAPGRRQAPRSSPVAWNDRVFLTRDGADSSSTLALDAGSGRELWRAERTGQGLASLEGGATPIVIGGPDGDQLVHLAPGYLAAYDPRSGDLLWRYRGLGRRAEASPVLDPSWGERGALAVVAAGDRPPRIGIFGVPGPGRRVETVCRWTPSPWWPEEGTPAMGGGHLYLLSRDPAFVVAEYGSCFAGGSSAPAEPSVGDGARVELPAGRYALDLVPFGRRFLAASLEGRLAVIEAGEAGSARLVRVIDSGESLVAAPVVDGDRLIVRTPRRLRALRFDP